MKLIVDERDNMSMVHLTNVYRMIFFVNTIYIPAALTKTLSCRVAWVLDHQLMRGLAKYHLTTYVIKICKSKDNV